MNVLFIHRSVGQNFLNEAKVRELLPDISLHDLNANTNTFTNEKGEQVSSIISVDNGNTNPDGLAAFFKKASNDEVLKTALSGYDVIAFKSCYTANQFKTGEELQNAESAYNSSIRDFITAHPVIKFLIISPPPRRPLLTTNDAAKRAMLFANFLEDFSSQFENATYFDLFGLLADDTGHLKRDYRRWLLVDQHPNHIGSIAAGEAFADVINSLQ